MKDKLMIVAVFVSIATYQLWVFMPKGFFYKGMALFILILSFIIYSDNKHKFVYFLLFCLSINNFLDECFFDPTKNGINEIAVCFFIIVFWYFKNKRNARKSITK
jgi:hypothetical protein